VPSCRIDPSVLVLLILVEVNAENRSEWVANGAHFWENGAHWALSGVRTIE
jgi:hypothetical protein